MNMADFNMIWIWLFIIVITLLVEIFTVGLTSIWMTGGALCALLVHLVGASVTIQLLVFFLVTFVLIFFTRPFAIKYINRKKMLTNYEEIIGKEVRVMETVNNQEGKGKAIYNGMEWMARAQHSEDTFLTDELAVVVAVEGVKLILKKKDALS